MNANRIFILVSSLASLPAFAGPYVIDGKNNLIIDGKNFSSSDSHCVQITNSQNVTIRNAVIYQCKGVGVSIYKSSNITIENSYFEDLNGGVYAVESSAIKVNFNRFKNVSTKKDDPSRGQFVQFNNVNGAGNEVSNNRGINEPGKSDPSDLVNLFQSSGTAQSPIQIIGNCFKGGGPSTSGGGLMTGDNGGSNMIVKENTLVDPGAYGIGIASGQNIQLLNNKVYGRQQSFTNVGIYAWNQSDTPCSQETVSGNSVDYTNASGEKNPYWDGGNCGAINWSPNTWNAGLKDLDCTLDQGAVAQSSGTSSQPTTTSQSSGTSSQPTTTSQSSGTSSQPTTTSQSSGTSSQPTTTSASSTNSSSRSSTTAKSSWFSRIFKRGG